VKAESDSQQMFGDLLNWLTRVGTLFLAAFIVAGIFANWRYFPSVDFQYAFKYWPQILISSLFAGIFHLIPASIVALVFESFLKMKVSLLTDILFAISFVSIPAFLALFSFKGFSFGVSEGELIHEGVRTSLGWYAYWMFNFQATMQMSIYLVLRIFTIRWLLRKISKSP
jgi:hypothetical protein